MKICREAHRESSDHHPLLEEGSRWPPGRTADVVSLFVILLIATAFLRPALRPGYTLLPLQWVSRLLPWSEYIDAPLQNTTLGDPFFAFYPRRQFFTEAVRAGEMPFWNPYMLGGYPAVGDTNAQTFYPPNWIAALLLSPARSFSVLAWFHLSLTGVLMFAMLRSHKLRASSSLLGAVSWMLSGILVVWLEHPHRLSSFAWLPGLFWMFNLSNRRRESGFSVLAGLLFGLMILGGQPQYAALGGLLLAVYAAFCSVSVTAKGLMGDSWPVKSLLIIGVIGLGVGSLQLLPTYAFARQSHREPRSVEVWLRQAMPFQHLTTFWLPNLFGSAEVGKHPYWGKLNYVEYTFYFGLPGLVLALLAPVLASERRISWLWALITILIVLIAVGSPLARLARWIPGMSYFSLHRMMSPVPFLGSWLAALGLDALSSRSETKGRAPVLALVLCTAGLILVSGLVLHTCRSGTRAHWDGVKSEIVRQGGILFITSAAIIIMQGWHRLGLLLFLAIAVIDLFTWGRTFNPVSDLELLYPDNKVTRLLHRDESLFRVLPLRNQKRVFGENVLSIFHMSTPDGYLALTLRHHKDLMYTISPYQDGAYGQLQGPHINLIVAQDFRELHGMLNVKYVLADHALDSEQLQHLATYHGVHVYENRDVLPRAYVVHRALVVPDDEVLDLLTSQDHWDYRTEILIPESEAQRAIATVDEDRQRGSLDPQIAEYGPNRVRIEADTEQAGFLVLSDPFYLGWHAKVNKRRVPIIRANHALRAVFLDAGRHDIEFVFSPPSLRTATLLAAASSAFALILLTVDSCRRPASEKSKEGSPLPSRERSL